MARRHFVGLLDEEVGRKPDKKLHTRGDFEPSVAFLLERHVEVGVRDLVRTSFVGYAQIQEVRVGLAVCQRKKAVPAYVFGEASVFCG